MSRSEEQKITRASKCESSCRSRYGDLRDQRIAHCSRFQDRFVVRATGPIPCPSDLLHAQPKIDSIDDRASTCKVSIEGIGQWWALSYWKWEVFGSRLAPSSHRGFSDNADGRRERSIGETPRARSNAMPASHAISAFFVVPKRNAKRSAPARCYPAGWHSHTTYRQIRHTCYLPRDLHSTNSIAQQSSIDLHAIAYASPMRCNEGLDLLSIEAPDRKGSDACGGIIQQRQTATRII